ncbi:50S ribosomal protein L4 [Patescibacteria group bacterium]|nr:MAG: 50S ribosomal protein L4 [Patescibacteria group bacterium]
MEAVVYNQKGEKAGKVKLPENIFGVKWNADLVHQVARSMALSARRGTAHSKTRGEVRGGGRKPWRQKGTGRARHGSIRSPIWVGGGVTHGPRKEKSYERKVNRKMKTKALFTILSAKRRDAEIIFLDKLDLPAPKTKEAKKAVSALGKIAEFKEIANRKKNAFLLTLPQRSDAVERGFRNFGNIEVEEIRNVSPLTLLKYKGIVVVDPANSFSLLAVRKGAKIETPVDKAEPAVIQKKPKRSVERRRRARAAAL